MTDQPQPQPLPLAEPFVPRLLRRDRTWGDVGIFDVLTLERIDELLFRNRINQANVSGQLFGGQVLAQSLAAACGTVSPDRSPHSLHGYFLRAGDAAQPVIFKVDRSRDGGSFSTRRVVAEQNGEAILHMECSFQIPRAGFDLQAAVPEVPGPDSLETLADILHANADRLPRAFVERFSVIGPFDIKPIDPQQVLGLSATSQRAAWIRVRGAEVSDNPLLHRVGLLYLSDFWLAAGAVNTQVPMWQLGSDLRISSLDHAMWFHRPVRIDDWMLYRTDSPSLMNGTGLNRGLIYDQSGALVASVTQEALYRWLKPNAG